MFYIITCVLFALDIGWLKYFLSGKRLHLHVLSDIEGIDTGFFNL